ncbi:MAG: sulfurtransferase complex subunit TusB [Betaproteobacteria bacterium]|nr:sulfurtransferase complex subunit TusB [Betaproteobacteria bacterium]
MLHIVNKSPFEKNALESCLRFGRDGSAVLLIEDGVYAVTRGNIAEPKIKAALGQMKIYALRRLQHASRNERTNDRDR